MGAEILGSYIIVLRETLEASLILAIILTVLSKTGRRDSYRYVGIGVIISIILGMISGILLWLIYNGFPEKELFEGISSIIAVSVLTSVIYWMAKAGPRITWSISSRVKMLSSGLAIVVFTMIIVYREVLETILLITPYITSSPHQALTGSVAGVISSIILSYLIYVAGYRINIRSFFLYTSILLVFIASGILGNGIHELAEWVSDEGIYNGFLITDAYNLGLSEDSILHNNGVIGSILAVLFGYSTSMEWIRLAVQALYILISVPIILKAYNLFK